MMSRMLLAGDVGGTKTLLGLFRPGAGDRPQPSVVREFATLDFDSLGELVDAFFDDVGEQPIRAACVGAAGPVTGLVARLTNVPWLVDAGRLAERLDDCPVALLNDLEAMAYAVPLLDDDELAVLQEGVPAPNGNAALIAAGTGLGEALLHNVDGRFVPSASEGGHSDFAARTPRELALVAELTRMYGRVDNERVISGPGLVNLFRFTHGSQDLARACRAIGPATDPADLPAEIYRTAMARRCEQCAEALDMLLEAYGAEAGNHALRSAATAGIYLGGGIAPKILPALERGTFIAAFCDKEPLTAMLRTMPVYVILNPQAGLIGAAIRAAEIASGVRP
jgi:glucokinase